MLFPEKLDRKVPVGIPVWPLINRPYIDCVSVAVPHELALDFDDHEVMSVEQANGSWTPVFSERVQFRCEVDDLVLHCVDGLVFADGGGSARIQVKCSFQQSSCDALARGHSWPAC